MSRNALIVSRAIVFLSGLVACVLAIVMAFRGELLWAVVCAVAAFSADMIGRVWSHKSPVPMPYLMRWALLVPRGPHSPKHLNQILQPRSGERILEIGPGIGVHALPMATLLLPNGVLDVLDVQRDMLVDLARRAARKGLANIEPTQGDAQKIPYADRAFDAEDVQGGVRKVEQPMKANHILTQISLFLLLAVDLALLVTILALVVIIIGPGLAALIQRLRDQAKRSKGRSPDVGDYKKKNSNVVGTPVAEWSAGTRSWDTKAKVSSGRGSANIKD